MIYFQQIGYTKNELIYSINDGAGSSPLYYYSDGKNRNIGQFSGGKGWISQDGKTFYLISTIISIYKQDSNT